MTFQSQNQSQNDSGSTFPFDQTVAHNESFNRWARAVRQQMLEALRKREQRQ
ncbi:MAG: hypothetical protein HC816_02920 [Leptolyngbyaceae cyanobacterium RM1_1_2]|nr:hypothetical protein [Leptolyngbyaceae cyanobacterium RM1_1_2]